MMGAIIGDIIGSPYEFNNIKTKDFPLFSEESEFTHDTVMTIAVAEALMRAKVEEVPFKSVLVEEMQRYGRTQPAAGYGWGFIIWLHAKEPQPYNSCGNGAAMRVSPCGLAADSLRQALMWSKESAEVSHNHPEGIKGAQATAAAIYLAKKGCSKKEIRNFMSGFDDLSLTCDQIRPTCEFDETCQGAVPQAIQAFLKSTSFEDAIRTAVSLGGDSDTLTAICGSIAFPYYTAQNGGVVPDDAYRMALAARRRLPHDFRDTIKLFQDIYDPYKYIREKVERECVIMETKKDLRVGLSGQMADYFMDGMK